MRVLRTGARLGHSTSERRRAIPLPPASVPGRRARGNRHAAPTPRPQTADNDDQDGQRPLDGPGHERARVATQPLLYDAVSQYHLAGHPAENGRSQIDDPPKPRHEANQNPAPPEHDRDRETDSEDDQRHVAVGGARDRQHVVEAHHHVGHDDDPDGFEESRALADLVLRLRVSLLGQELDGDPEEDEPPGRLEQGDTEQEADDGDEDDPERDGPEGPPDAPLPLLFRRQL